MNVYECMIRYGGGIVYRCGLSSAFHLSHTVPSRVTQNDCFKITPALMSSKVGGTCSPSSTSSGFQYGSNLETELVIAKPFPSISVLLWKHIWLIILLKVLISSNYLLAEVIRFQTEMIQFLYFAVGSNCSKCNLYNHFCSFYEGCHSKGYCIYPRVILYALITLIYKRFFFF